MLHRADMIAAVANKTQGKKKDANPILAAGLTFMSAALPHQHDLTVSLICKSTVQKKTLAAGNARVSTIKFRQPKSCTWHVNIQCNFAKSVVFTRF
ncbi:MAG: HU family DNA-binding protein [Paracoccaceae bacterium]